MNYNTARQPRSVHALRPRRRRGVAMILVITAIAIAAILGFAMLSGAMLQTRTSGNAAKAAQADYLAESGLNLAMLYLQYPDKAPTRNANGYWGGGDFTVGSAPPLTMSVSVARDATDSNVYEVSSIGKVGVAGETQLTRTLLCRMAVQTGYRMKYATGSNGSLTLYGGTTITGDVISPNAVVLKTASTVTGKVYAPGVSVPVGYPAAPQNLPVPTDAVAAPIVNDINRYATYSYSGATGTAETVNVLATSLPNVLAPTNLLGTNPAKVWVTDGNMTINDNFVLDGTLVVKGNLTINGAGIAINPKTGMPGLIVIGNLIVNQPRKAATVNGVVYIGGQLKTSGVLLNAPDASVLNINGGLLMGSNTGTPIATGYNATTNIKLDSSLVNVPDLSTTGRTPMSISVKRWGPTPTAPYAVVN